VAGRSAVDSGFRQSPVLVHAGSGTRSYTSTVRAWQVAALQRCGSARSGCLCARRTGRRGGGNAGGLKWNGGFAPYGYKLVDGKLEIAEDEVEIIRIIFDRYIHTNEGINGVANYLNSHGYTKKLRQNNTIPGFSASFVKKVLDNPVYMGKIAYGRRRTEKKIGTRNEMHVVEQSEFPVYDGKHEAIISEADWNLAQEKRKKNAYRREKVHDVNHVHLLSGLLRCPDCGKPLYGNIAKAHSKDNKMDKQMLDEFYATAERNWEHGVEDINSINNVGNYMVTLKEGVTRNPHNYLYYVYKVNIDTEDGEFTYYWYGYFTDIMILEDGTCTVDISGYTVSESSSFFGLTDGDYLKCDANHYVAGFKEIDSLFNKQIVSKSDLYEYKSTITE